MPSNWILKDLEMKHTFITLFKILAEPGIDKTPLEFIKIKIHSNVGENDGSHGRERRTKEGISRTLLSPDVGCIFSFFFHVPAVVTDRCFQAIITQGKDFLFSLCPAFPLSHT